MFQSGTLRFIFVLLKQVGVEFQVRAAVDAVALPASFGWTQLSRCVKRYALICDPRELNAATVRGAAFVPLIQGDSVFIKIEFAH
jgi:hypothetical protein